MLVFFIVQTVNADGGALHGDRLKRTSAMLLHQTAHTNEMFDLRSYELSFGLYLLAVYSLAISLFTSKHDTKSMHACLL